MGLGLGPNPAHKLAMKRKVRIQGTFFLILAQGALAGDYSQMFFKTYGTNYTTEDSIQSTALVERGNSAPKLDPVIQLSRVKEFGELAHVRVGMSMDEVVDKWGKPSSVYARFPRVPRFDYLDVCVDFKDGGVNALTIWDVNLSGRRFSHGLSANSGYEAWRKALGEPTGLSISSARAQMWYTTNGHAMYLSFTRQGDVLCDLYIRRATADTPNSSSPTVTGATGNPRVETAEEYRFMDYPGCLTAWSLVWGQQEAAVPLILATLDRLSGETNARTRHSIIQGALYNPQNCTNVNFRSIIQRGTNDPSESVRLLTTLVVSNAFVRLQERAPK